MNNVEKTAWKIQASCPQGRVLTIDQALVVANVLEEAGLLAPAPQIVRTQEELEALDPDTLVGTHSEIVSSTFGAGYIIDVAYLGDLMFPMVVVASGDQVRAAREAMEKDNE